MYGLHYTIIYIYICIYIDHSFYRDRPGGYKNIIFWLQLFIWCHVFFIGSDLLLPQGYENSSLLAKIIHDSVRDRVCVSTAVGTWSPRLLHDVILLCYAVEREVSILCVYKLHRAVNACTLLMVRTSPVSTSTIRMECLSMQLK